MVATQTYIRLYKSASYWYLTIASTTFESFFLKKSDYETGNYCVCLADFICCSISIVLR
mgnify:CR=1 FL=1